MYSHLNNLVLYLCKVFFAMLILVRVYQLNCLRSDRNTLVVLHSAILSFSIYYYISRTILLMNLILYCIHKCRTNMAYYARNSKKMRVDSTIKNNVQKSRCGAYVYTELFHDDAICSLSSPMM